MAISVTSGNLLKMLIDLLFWITFKNIIIYVLISCFNIDNSLVRLIIHKDSLFCLEPLPNGSQCRNVYECGEGVGAEQVFDDARSLYTARCG